MEVEISEHMAAMKKYWDAYSITKTSYDKGHAEGLTQRNLEIARSMKADKLPIETIIKYTGLSAEEIDAL